MKVYAGLMLGHWDSRWGWFRGKKSIFLFVTCGFFWVEIER